VTDDIDLHQK